MTLQDELYTDIMGVFLNTDEFAETHVINEKEIPCVVDGDRLLERSGAAATGVYLDEKLIFVKASDLAGKPAIGSRMTFDGKSWIVTSLGENFGMYEIQLRINKT